MGKTWETGFSDDLICQHCLVANHVPFGRERIKAPLANHLPRSLLKSIVESPAKKLAVILAWTDTAEQKGLSRFTRSQSGNNAVIVYVKQS